MTAAFLWQADGPEIGTRGVVDDEGRARRLAAECLLSGTAVTAVVDEAATDLGRRTLESGYHRTGRGWAGRVDGGGRVRWTRVTATWAAVVAAPMWDDR